MGSSSKEEKKRIPLILRLIDSISLNLFVISTRMLGSDTKGTEDSLRRSYPGCPGAAKETQQTQM